MTNSTRQENLQKLKKVSGGFEKAAGVLKILLIILASFMAACAIFSAIAGVTGLMNKMYEAFPDFWSKVKVDYDSKGLMFIKSGSTTLKELYEQGLLNKFMYGNAVSAIGIASELAIYAIILHFLKKLFASINESETPFNPNLLTPFKVCFIILTIVIVFRYSLFPGILIGGLLACLYFIYAYGCNMQEDEDQTL